MVTQMLEKSIFVVLTEPVHTKKKLSIPFKYLNPSLIHVQYYLSGCIMFKQLLSVRKYKKSVKWVKKWVMKDIMIFKHLYIYNVTLSSVFNSIIMLTDIYNTNNSHSNQIFRSACFYGSSSLFKCWVLIRSHFFPAYICVFIQICILGHECVNR